MDLGSAARGILAFLLFIPALQCETNWSVTYTSSNVCALRGSTVNISVSYEYTHHKPQSSSIDKEPLWLTKIGRNNPVDTASDPHYKGRVEYNCGKNKCTASTCSGECTLTIKDLKLSDSAEYKFWITTAQTDWEYTGIPGVNLTVRDLQVKMAILNRDKPTEVDLECHSICSLLKPTYMWLSNGVKEDPGKYYHRNAGKGRNEGLGRYYRGTVTFEDSYACAVEGFEGFPSPSVYAPKTPSVTVSPSGEVEEGSSVTLSCSSDANPAANYTWFKEHDDSVAGSGPTYTLTNMTSEHKERYYCQAYNAIGHHNSNWLSVNVTVRPSSSLTSLSSSSVITGAAVGTVAVFLATVIFLWLRKRRVSRKARDQGGRPDTAEEGQPIEQQYSFINFPGSKTQEMPHRLPGSAVQSDQSEQVLYSVVQFERSNTLSENHNQTGTGETSEMYSTVQNAPRV